MMHITLKIATVRIIIALMLCRITQTPNNNYFHHSVADLILCEKDFVVF
jgi:hypothetical protein